jgi:hypothetical protein
MYNLKPWEDSIIGDLAGALISIILLFFIGFNFYTVITAINWEFNQKTKLVSTETGSILVSTCVNVTGYRVHKSAPIIQYNYRVNSMIFSSARISYYPTEGCSVMNQYPLGKQVKVYYDPANPSFAVLEPGLEKSGLQSLISNIPASLSIALLTVLGLPISFVLLDKFKKIGRSKPRLTRQDN